MSHDHNHAHEHDQEYLDHLRHSAAHLLGAALKELYPEVKLTIGPAIENGFYYDVWTPEALSEKDLPKIEQKMRQLVKKWTKFERSELSVDEALAFYPDNEFKQELIKEFSEEGKTLSFYQAGHFKDLCRGGHIENPSLELKAFKLISLAGAYWRGSEKNPMLSRIYGAAFPTQEELDEYLARQELAKQRDHKKLGKELDLFVFSETVGKGLPLWTPKGAVVRRQLERFIVDEELRRGYLHVYTPDIANLALYKKSGHYPYYKDSMYAPIQIDDEEYMLRPMTCPHHFELYLTQQHSYKELPMRFAELAKLYRYEQSGELSGLLRVRSFCLADAHIVCRKSQAEDEINGVLDLIEYLADVFGLKAGEHYSYRLSLGDRADDKKYFKDDESWDFAENVLRSVLQERKAHFVEAPQEAAFYGPKIDVQMRNVNGKEDTAFTVQYDFVMPQRFELKYINEKGEAEQPIVVHRSSIGAIERVVAFLIEHYGGAFPVWLAPVQIKLLPIAERHLDYSREVLAKLRAAGIRAELDESSESLGKKIRSAQMEKIPYMAVIGDTEQEAGQVAVRRRDDSSQAVISTAELISELQPQLWPVAA